MTEYNVYGKKSYAFAIGRLSGTTHAVLREETLTRLREADFDTAQKLLIDCGYPAVTDGKTVYDAIEEEKNAVSAFVREISPDEELTQLLFFEEDSLNLKLLLKSAVLEREADDSLLCEGSFPTELLRVCVQVGDYSLLSETIGQMLEGIEQETDPGRISCLVDNAMFAHALHTAEKKHCTPLVRLFTVYGEGKNRLTALRLRRLQMPISEYGFAFLPVGTPPNEEERDEETILSETRAQLENVLTDLGYDEGIGAIAQYYFRKKSETAALRLLFAEKSAKETGGSTS